MNTVGAGGMLQCFIHFLKGREQRNPTTNAKLRDIKEKSNLLKLIQLADVHACSHTRADRSRLTARFRCVAKDTHVRSRCVTDGQ